MMFRMLLTIGCLTVASPAAAIIIQPLPDGEHVIITESDPATIDISVKSFLSPDPTALPANADGTFMHTYTFGFVIAKGGAGMIEIVPTGFDDFNASLTGPGIDHPPLDGLPLQFQVEPQSSSDLTYTLTITGSLLADNELGQYVGSIAVSQVDIPEPAAGLLLLLATGVLLSYRQKKKSAA